MRSRDADVLDARATHPEQAVPNANDDLCDDLGPAVLTKKVVHVGDGARVRVLYRNDRGVGLVRLERREDLGEGAPRGRPAARDHGSAAGFGEAAAGPW